MASKEAIKHLASLKVDLYEMIFSPSLPQYHAELAVSATEKATKGELHLLRDYKRELGLSSGTPSPSSPPAGRKIPQQNNHPSRTPSPPPIPKDRKPTPPSLPSVQINMGDKRKMEAVPQVEIEIPEDQMGPPGADATPPWHTGS